MIRPFAHHPLRKSDIRNKMTVLDYFVLIVVVASIASGATRGILKGVISVLTVVIALLVAAFLYEPVAAVTAGFVDTARAANLVAFIGVFLLVMLVGGFVSRRLRGRLRRARLNWLDHTLGAGFGLVRGWLFCSVIYLALTAFPVKLETVERATFAPFLLEGTRVIAYLTSSEMRERFFEGYAAVRSIWEEEN
jgi:membrane protein required for colicin V production